MKIIQNKEEKLILIISSIASVFISLIVIILSLFIEEVKWTWSISVIIGQIVSIGCFFKSNAIINKVLYDDITQAKFLLILNNMLGTLCYTISLIINILVPGLNIILNGIGILILKFTTFIIGTFSKSEVK